MTAEINLARETRTLSVRATITRTKKGFLSEKHINKARTAIPGIIY